MARLVTVLEKPVFFSWKEGETRLCWYNDYTVVVEDDKGKTTCLPVTLDDLYDGSADQWLDDKEKEDLRIYDEVSYTNLNELLEGHSKEDSIMLAVSNVIRYIAGSKVKVNFDVLKDLANLKKNIDAILENQHSAKG